MERHVDSNVTKQHKKVQLLVTGRGELPILMVATWWLVFSNEPRSVFVT